MPKGVRKGMGGVKTPLSLICYHNFITCSKEIIAVFTYFLLLNLLT